MHSQGLTSFRTLSALALLATATFALPSCTNNSAPQAQAAPSDANNPTLTALPVPAKADPFAGSLLDSLLWKSAQWVPMTPAPKETRTAPLTKVASLYDDQRLYIALVGVDNPVGNSAISVWLDTSKAQNGTEMLEIVANVGETSQPRSVTWHRCVNPPEIRDTPDFGLPMQHFPLPPKEIPLKFQSGTTAVEGKKAWTMIVAIPLASLPGPLKTVPAGGVSKWRINLLRQDSTAEENGKNTIQANLSPVFPNAQTVMPYRMAVLELRNAPAKAVAAAR